MAADSLSLSNEGTTNALRLPTKALTNSLSNSGVNNRLTLEVEITRKVTWAFLPNKVFKVRERS